MSDGWIKLQREILDNPVVCKDSDYFSVWCYLLLNATHKEMDVEFKNERITLRSGQLVTGRKKIAEHFNINETKVQRILKKLENEQQIEQQTSTKNRLITIVNWDKYQKCEQQNEQQVNNKCTTSEQQVNTNKNVIMEERKNERNNIVADVINYLNEKTGKSFRSTVTKNRDLIKARLNEGYSLEEFKKVIDIKVAEWLNDETMSKFLRPETLFSNKFEGYLNQKPKQEVKKRIKKDPYASIKER